MEHVPENEYGYILMHEKTHIKWLDYLIKPLAFAAVCLHWFNPLVWASFYKKPSIWAVTAAIILVSAAGIGLMANPQNDESDLSLLSINSTASAAAQQDQILIRVHGLGASIISGNEFGKFLEQAYSNWSEKKVVSSDKKNPDLTIYINVGSEYMAHFYKLQPDLAAVQFKGKCRYYEIPQGTYEKVYFMYAVRSYAIPEEVMKAITDGKRTDLRSVQDVPDNTQPYQFINEITGEVYKGAVKFAEPARG